MASRRWPRHSCVRATHNASRREEDDAPVPAPVLAPAAPTALAPILVALMGREPHIVADLDATGFHEIPADFHAPVHLPAHAPAPALTCAPVPVPMHTNVSAAPFTTHVPVRVPVPPSAAWMAAIDRYLSAAPVAVLPRPARRSRDDMMFDLQAKNILCCLEYFNNGVPEDDNDNDGAARRLRRRRK